MFKSTPESTSQSSDVPNGNADANSPWRKLYSVCIAITALVFLIAYFVRTGWELTELLLFIFGIIFLWTPIAGLVFIFLKSNIENNIARFTLSIASSYTLTTLLYFVLAIFNLDSPFVLYPMIIAAWSYLIWSCKGKLRQNYFNFIKSDKTVYLTLFLLIALSLFVNTPYKNFVRYEEDSKSYKYLLARDHFYHVGQVYELLRNIPPLQNPIRAGTPERAYHNFPHITTALISKTTFQADLLRVHCLYHYTVIETLLCLSIFCIVMLLTKSATGGYIAVVTLYLGAIYFPKLSSSPHGIFYFTIFPHRSSGLEPVAVNSPQMYSGLVVAYGILLALVVLSQNLYKKKNATSTLVLTALLIASLMKFRIHEFIVFFPLFLAMLALFWVKERRKIFLLTGLLLISISLFLYAEMNSSVYLEKSSSIRIGNNEITSEPSHFFNFWPSSGSIYNFLDNLISNGDVFSLVWQIVSITAFVVFNIIGIPLIIATVYFAFSKKFKREFLTFYYFCICLLLISTIGGMFLSSEYDNWSVGGQMPLHTRWYIFPFLAVAIFALFNRVKKRLHVRPAIWTYTGISMLALLTLIRSIEPPGALRGNAGATFTENEWNLFEYIRTQTPQNVVLASRDYFRSFILSGMTGRPVYLERPGNTVDELAHELQPEDDRSAILKSIWRAKDANMARELLKKTKVTHLVEVNSRISDDTKNILSIEWQSHDGKAKLWKVNPD